MSTPRSPSTTPHCSLTLALTLPPNLILIRHAAHVYSSSLLITRTSLAHRPGAIKIDFSMYTHSDLALVLGLF